MNELMEGGEAGGAVIMCFCGHFEKVLDMTESCYWDLILIGAASVLSSEENYTLLTPYTTMLRVLICEFIDLLLQL